MRTGSRDVERALARQGATRAADDQPAMRGASRPSEAEHGHQVVVATDAKLDAGVFQKSTYDWLKKASCIVVDEAHTSVGPSYTRMLEWQGLGARRRRKRPRHPADRPDRNAVPRDERRGDQAARRALRRPTARHQGARRRRRLPRTATHRDPRRKSTTSSSPVPTSSSTRPNSTELQKLHRLPDTAIQQTRRRRRTQPNPPRPHRRLPPETGRSSSSASPSTMRTRWPRCFDAQESPLQRSPPTRTRAPAATTSTSSATEDSAFSRTTPFSPPGSTPRGARALHRSPDLRPKPLPTDDRPWPPRAAQRRNRPLPARERRRQRREVRTSPRVPRLRLPLGEPSSGSTGATEAPDTHPPIHEATRSIRGTARESRTHRFFPSPIDVRVDR